MTAKTEDKYSEMVEEYIAELRETVDWDQVERELAKECNEAEDMDGNRCAELYIGSVFALTPSGKYYMPWACGNVTEEEARKDEAWFEALDSVCGDHGMYYTSGEGDPCDLYIGKSLA